METRLIERPLMLYPVATARIPAAAARNRESFSPRARRQDSREPPEWHPAAKAVSGEQDNAVANQPIYCNICVPAPQCLYTCLSYIYV